MKIVSIKGQQAFFKARSVFHNGKFVATADQAALLQEFPTADLQKANGIEVSVRTYFRHEIVEGITPELEKALPTAKVVNGYFKKDDASGKWLLISSAHCLSEGEIVLNKDGKYFVSCEKAEKITMYCKSQGIDATPSLIAAGLM